MNYYQQPFVFSGQPAPQQMFFPQQVPGFVFPEPVQQGVFPPIAGQFPQRPPVEQSYIENILRLNLGKVATVYMNFEGAQWGSKIFKGYVLAAGKDHIILQDLNSELRYILLTIFLNYITFDEEIEYEYPFRGKKTKK